MSAPQDISTYDQDVQSRSRQQMLAHTRSAWNSNGVQLIKEFGSMFDRAKGLRSRALYLLPEHDLEFSNRVMLDLRKECFGMKVTGVRETFIRKMNNLVDVSYSGQAHYFSTDYQTAKSLVEDTFLERTATVARLKQIIAIAVKAHIANWIDETSKFQQTIKDANIALCAAINDYVSQSPVTKVEDITVERLQQYHKFLDTIMPHKCLNRFIKYPEYHPRCKYIPRFSKKTAAFRLQMISLQMLAISRDFPKSITQILISIQHDYDKITALNTDNDKASEISILISRLKPSLRSLLF